MLVPVSSTHQPFRFVALPESDRSTLQAAFQSPLYRNTDEAEWIEEIRAAVVNWNAYPWSRRIRTIPAFILAALCLGSVIYFFSVHLK